MHREGSTLSPAKKEMIVVAISSANGCQYCVVAHGAMLRVFSKDPLLADQIMNSSKPLVTMMRIF